MADDIIPSVPEQPPYPNPPTPPGAETVTTPSRPPTALPAPEPSSAPASETAPAPGKPGFWRSLFSSPPAQPNQPPVDSTREIIETVVFVIVLVLMLKSFVAEAFVIPTGSMAETLWGYQKVVTCPECEYQFPVNCSKEVEAQDNRGTERVHSCVCPNCRKAIFLQAPFPMPNDNHTAGPNQATIPDPGPTSGDRVLVAKFLYDLFNRDPDRLDVVVFKFPGDSNPHPQEAFPSSGPFKKQVPMNYIKRLIGLPGETIAIQGGKLYILPPDMQPASYRDPKKEPQPENPNEAWMWRYMYNNDPAALALFEQGQFRILRKAPDSILAMKRIVYDNDHQAKDLKGKIPPRWSGEGWSAEDPTVLQHPEGDKLSWLRYRNLLRDHLLADGKPEPRLISDFMGYNTDNNSGGENHWVRDLVLECEAVIDQAQGELVLELARGVDRFQARFNLADGSCKLVRVGEDGKSTELKSGQAGVQKGDYRLRLSDVDERLFLWVNDKLIFPEGVNFDAPANPCPTKNDLEPAGIAVQGAAVQIKHLKLFRDTYYTTNNDTLEGKDLIVDGNNNWAAFKHMPVRTMYVQPDHFLCLGDNSPHSADSRSWGLVPRRLLLGKALAVYYPFYFPFWPLNSQVNRLGLIH